MIKPTASYRMSKTAKRMLATIVDPQIRGALKQSVIQAELAAAIRPKASKENKE